MYLRGGSLREGTVGGRRLARSSNVVRRSRQHVESLESFRLDPFTHAIGEYK